jgi:cytochrome c6
VSDSRPCYNDLLLVESRRQQLSHSFRDPLRRAACTVALVMVACAAACSRPSPAAAPVDAPAVFAQACAKCHAADGTGGLPMAENGPRPIDLTAPEWHRSRSDAELVASIRSGRGAMPPFEGVLSVDEINALGSYVRTLKRP